ncbi:Biotin synthase OS=Streptomyces tendae OX=1932 GN=bioB PE=3 SV=1 [Streptomyces tendae]
MTRFVCPDVEVRIAGGREVHLRNHQPLALHLANSIFLGDYLTSEGQAGHADLEMIADAGFSEGAEVTLPEHRAAAQGGGCGSHAGDGGCGSHAGGGVCAPAAAAAPTTLRPAEEPRTDLVAVRRRGAGTDLAPNA